MSASLEPKLSSPAPSSHSEKLKEYLKLVPPGEISDHSKLAGMLANAWKELDGSDESGMRADKLWKRMETVKWQPPILSFVIERHGATCCGSTRAELQHWEVDIDRRTAGIIKVSRRQLYSMAPREKFGPLADEIVQKILSGEEDDRIKRLADGSVNVLVAAKIYPTSSGYKETITNRRKRLKEEIAKRLDEHGWVQVDSRGRYCKEVDQVPV